MAPNTINPGTFGALIIGEAAAQQEAIIVEKGGNVFGALVVDDLEAVAAGEAVQHAHQLAPKNDDELKTALEEHPDAFDALLEAEFHRAEGPRKRWLRVFLSVERARPEQRDAVIDRINDGLEVAGS